jgi:HPt (histidine-containing phosphotransfer) domain-containing protein
MSQFNISGASTTNRQPENESALCKETLQRLRELGVGMGTSFFPQLLEIFRFDAAKRLAALRRAITGCEAGRLRGEAHALKGASLTLGAQGMADICQRLENLGIALSVKGASEELARLEYEFERVKDDIEHESLFP